MARPFDTVLQNLARIVARMLYRSVDVAVADTSWADSPAVLVANHFGGFSDPALLIAILGRPPRFLAKATLWKNPIVGKLLDAGGAIPVYRAQDGSTAGNRDTFDACYEALAEGEQIALFPEGTTHDEPAMKRLRTGAARIALGAVAFGVDRPLIVPVGIHYEDKVAFRSRAAVEIGRPIDAVGAAGAADPSDHEAVHRLTAIIDERLRKVAPEFATWEEAHALGFAAEVALREELGDGRVPFGLRERMAAVLVRAPRPSLKGVIDAVAAYREMLDAAGVEEEDVAAAHRPGSRRPIRSTLLTGLFTLLLLPFALAGVVLNAVPAVVTSLSSRLRMAPVTLATVRVLVGLVAFLGTWTAWAFLVAGRWGWRFGYAVFLLAPFYGLAAVWVAERLVGWFRHLRRRGATPGDLIEARHEVVTAVITAMDAAAEAA